MADIPVADGGEGGYNMASVGIVQPGLHNFGMPSAPQGVPVHQQPLPTYNPQMAGQQFLGGIETLATNPIARIGISQVQQQLGSLNMGFLTSWHHMLRYYFSVNNYYVLNKLKILLCPFIHNSWSRKIVENAAGVSYLPPAEDVNAPDLYIPAMAFITYILVIALFMGSTFRFTPEVLGMTASTGLFALSLEIILIRLALFIFGFPSIPLLDLLAYTGYKFVGVTQITLAGIFLGNLAFFIAFLIHALFMGSFMVKTLRLVLPKSVDEGGSSKYLRSYFLLAVALLQAVVAFFLCYLDFKYKAPPMAAAVGPMD